MAKSTVDEGKLIEKYQPLTRAVELIDFLNRVIALEKQGVIFDYKSLSNEMLCGFVIGVGLNSDIGKEASDLLLNRLVDSLGEIEVEDG